MQTETIQDGNAVDANVTWAIERWHIAVSLNDLQSPLLTHRKLWDTRPTFEMGEARQFKFDTWSTTASSSQLIIRYDTID